MPTQDKQPAAAQASHHGPPMEFSMPMFRAFVPRGIRPWIYVAQAFCFQFSNGMYLGAMNNVVGERGLMREDVQMCLYATLIGMALYFPILFRMKFRFSNRALLVVAATVVLVCQWLTTLPLPLPLLWTLCLLCGMAKIQGTFENLSNIQLWMTSKRDMGVFFPLLHLILLTAIEYTGYLAAWFAYAAHWTLMHWFVMGLMLLVLAIQLSLTKPFHAMPKIVPLRGLDFTGMVLWAAFWLQVAYALNYGDWLDWWNAEQFRLVCGTACVTLALCLLRMFHYSQPYYEPAMWGYRNVLPIILLIGVVEALYSCEHVLETVYYEEVMHYADRVYERLNLWSLIGSWTGCLFALGWFKCTTWNAYKLIAVGLSAFAVYAAGFYFLIGFGLNIEALRLPLVFRGFGYAVLSVALMWSLFQMLSFQHFFQALSVFNMIHMFAGGLVGAALHGRGMKYYMADAFARYSGSVDAVRVWEKGFDLETGMGGLVEGFLAQSVKVLFGWTLLAALFFAMAMLLWDIPLVRHSAKRMQSWPEVGLQVLRSYHRPHRLRRLWRRGRVGEASRLPSAVQPT